MVRENRLKNYTFSSSDLIGVANGSPNSSIDKYTSHVINGTIQEVYWKAGNHVATGSLWIDISGMSAVGNILTLTSGETYNIGTDFAVFPFATTVTTNMVGISGANGYNKFVQIPVNSIIRVVASGVGVNKSGGELSITYI